MEAPIVKRAAMAWRNDLENIPIFLFLGLIYVTLGCSPEGAYIYFTIFIVARFFTRSRTSTAGNHGEQFFSRSE